MSEDGMTLWEQFWWPMRRWVMTRIFGRCYGCGIPMLPEDAEYDPRVQDGTHSTVESVTEDGRLCYGCVHYADC